MAGTACLETGCARAASLPASFVAQAAMAVRARIAARATTMAVRVGVRCSAQIPHGSAWGSSERASVLAARERRRLGSEGASWRCCRNRSCQGASILAARKPLWSEGATFRPSSTFAATTACAVGASERFGRVMPLSFIDLRRRSIPSSVVCAESRSVSGCCDPPAEKECEPPVSCCGEGGGGGGGACGDGSTEKKVGEAASSSDGGKSCRDADIVPESEAIHENVKEYYGKTLSSNDDLETNACIIGSMKTPGIGKLMGNIHPKVLERFYGCGSPIPPLLEGLTVLDLGCGTGTDVYLSAQLVGEKGRVIGIDMTDEQLAVAREVEDWQREKFGYTKSNVVLKKAFIEDLKAADVADESVDVIISNCVINLAPDKRPVLIEIARILKPGGELYFSDVFADRRIPKHLRDDKVLFGECLSGALYVKDFGQLMSEVGLGTWGVVSHSLITVNNEKILKLVGDITFYSLTVRAIKIDPSKLEDTLEDFGQTATYDGAIPGYEESFSLDMKNTFVKGKPTPIDGMTASLLLSSRYGSHFSVTEKGSHKGIFSGGNAIAGGDDGWALFLAKEAKDSPAQSGSSCC